jgi:hypothetical protein
MELYISSDLYKFRFDNFQTHGEIIEFEIIDMRNDYILQKTTINIDEIQLWVQYILENFQNICISKDMEFILCFNRNYTYSNRQISSIQDFFKSIHIHNKFEYKSIDRKFSLVFSKIKNNKILVKYYRNKESVSVLRKEIILGKPKLIGPLLYSLRNYIELDDTDYIFFSQCPTDKNDLSEAYSISEKLKKLFIV